MKTALIVSSVASMIKQFNMRNINILISKGFKVTVATNFLNPGTITSKASEQLISELESLGVEIIQIDFSRGIGSVKKNIEIYRQLKSLSSNDYTIVHVHSPIASVLVRTAFKKSSSYIIYTAHGFHFFKGSSIKSWILFYPLEKFLSNWTDLLLTINNEDTKIAKKFNNCKVLQLPGVGIDYDKLSNPIDDIIESQKLKDKLNISDHEYIFLSIGELNDRKNHLSAIKALKHIDKPYKYLICGTGPMERKLKSVVNELQLNDKIIFMGYFDNIPLMTSIADLSFFLSKREGLGLAGLESLASGVPLISSYINGIKDYTSDGQTGFTVSDPTDEEEIAKAITKWIDLDDKEKEDMKEKCRIASKHYDKKNVDKIMDSIYSI